MNSTRIFQAHYEGQPSGGKSPSQPAIMPVEDYPPPYTPSAAAISQASAAADDLRRRQAELEQKEAELARKEQEMQRTMQGQSKHSFYVSFYIIPLKIVHRFLPLTLTFVLVRQNNFPPLPSKCCIEPCFYQDFNVDIPLEFQRIVKIGYYLWMG